MTQDDFSQKEILKMVWEETQKQSHILSTLTSEMREVKEQTTKTNGRVTSLEGRTGMLERMQDGLAIKVGAGVTIVSAVLMLFLNRYL